MRTSLILTSLVAFGLAGAANATVAKPMAAPANTSMAAKKEAKEDKVEARHAKHHARHGTRHHAHTMVTKKTAKPAATHG